MEPEHDPYDFDGKLFEPDEARRYWTIVAKIQKLPKDEEVRLLVEVPILLAKVTLREVARMVAKLEAKQVANDAEAQSLEKKSEEFEELVDTYKDLVKDLNWDLRSKTFSHALAAEVRDVVQTELKEFFASLPKRGSVDVR